MSWQGMLIQVELSRQALDDKVVIFSHRCEEQDVSLYCNKGCSNCCTLAVSCSFPEAVALVNCLSQQQQQQILETLPLLESLSREAQNLKQFLKLYREKCGTCPLLDTKGSCSVYEQRPLSCRALLSTRPADWCAVDFSTLHPLEMQAFISSLDPKVVAYPGHYLAASQEEGATLQASICSTMLHKYGFFLTGNLLWLMGMELKYQLSGALDSDRRQIKDWLGVQQQLHPFLLELETEISRQSPPTCCG